MRVLAPGEEKRILVPWNNATEQPLLPTDAGAGARFDKTRRRLGVEICYCSTLGDCWTLIKRVDEVSRVEETRRCPPASSASFQQ